ncbi:KEOPS complex subunit Cgi121 [Halobaculum sp. MBLA0143]|uniref:KEOPS complex subunit Cgi121 n=1 Tax=Halobaculum sp. MBLA0143 TaxID=3079933 RepID=UPI0035238E3A
MERLTGTERIEDLDDTLAAVDRVADTTDCTVQGFDARYVADETHLRRALTLADRAFDRGENVARDRGVEVLLYAAGRRQIDRALEMGLSEGETPVVYLVAARGTDEDADGSTDRDDGTADEDDGTAEREHEAVRRLRERSSFTPGEVTPDSDRLRSFFDVSDRELAATDGTLAAVVHERVALLDVEK